MYLDTQLRKNIHRYRHIHKYKDTQIHSDKHRYRPIQKNHRKIQNISKRHKGSQIKADTDRYILIQPDTQTHRYNDTDTCAEPDRYREVQPDTDIFNRYRVIDPDRHTGTDI